MTFENAHIPNSYRSFCFFFFLRCSQIMPAHWLICRLFLLREREVVRESSTSSSLHGLSAGTYGSTNTTSRITRTKPGQIIVTRRYICLHSGRQLPHISLLQLHAVVSAFVPVQSRRLVVDSTTPGIIQVWLVTFFTFYAANSVVYALRTVITHK